MGKDKLDVSKLELEKEKEKEKEKKKKEKDPEKEKAKKKEDKGKNPAEKQLNYGIDTSNLTNAEYEALFLQRFENLEKNQSQNPSSKNQSSSKDPFAPPIIEFSELKESDTSKQGGAEKLDSKSLKKAKDEQNNKNNKDDKENANINYVRHCPKCNNFLKTTDPGSISCPKCNTQMLFAINCQNCSLWFDVKSNKKYPCPKCGDLISHN